MNLKILIIFILSFCYLSGCADYKVQKINKIDTKQYYSSSGFVLIYEDTLYEKKTINKKIDNSKILVMHNNLKTNTPIKIINPSNSKTVETKIYKKATYPNIFHMVISKKTASLLDLDENNPFVEITEIKKNEKFTAKKSNTYQEEKNVADNAPV